VRRRPPLNANGLPRHIAGPFAAQPGAGAGDIFRLAGAANRHHLADGFRSGSGNWRDFASDMIVFMMMPGGMLLTVMPSGPSSSASPRVIEMIAPLEEQ